MSSLANRGNNWSSAHRFCLKTLSSPPPMTALRHQALNQGRIANGNVDAYASGPQQRMSQSAYPKHAESWSIRMAETMLETLPQGLAAGTATLMARAISIIEQEIRALSSSEKEQLLRILLEELDGPPDPDVNAAWLEEAQRRSREIDAGTVQCVPADEVFAKVDALLKK